jgi:hypothetical protein
MVFPSEDVARATPPCPPANVGSTLFPDPVRSHFAKTTADRRTQKTANTFDRVFIAPSYNGKA